MSIISQSISQEKRRESEASRARYLPLLRTKENEGLRDALAGLVDLGKVKGKREKNPKDKIHAVRLVLIRALPRLLGTSKTG